MKYDQIKTHKDAFDMMEAELITMQDYINVCNFHNWPARDSEPRELNTALYDNIRSNLIRLKLSRPENRN